MRRRTRIITSEFSSKPFGPVRNVVFEVLDGVLVGRRFRLVVSHGRKMRIPYKPRGTFGWKWTAICFEVAGRQVWAASECDKGIGCDRVLGLIEEDSRIMHQLIS